MPSLVPASPDVPVLDDFDRADGTPGSNWITDVGDAHDFHIISGEAGWASGAAGGWWTHELDGDFEIRITQGSVYDLGWDLMLKPASDRAQSYTALYDLEADTSISGIAFYKFKDGGWSTPGAAAGGLPQPGDIYRIRKTGNLIESFRVRSGTTTLLHSFTDADPIPGPYLAGFTTWTSLGRFDEFGASQVVPASSGALALGPAAGDVLTLNAINQVSDTLFGAGTLFGSSTLFGSAPDLTVAAPTPLTLGTP